MTQWPRFGQKRVFFLCSRFFSGKHVLPKVLFKGKRGHVIYIFFFVSQEKEDNLLPTIRQPSFPKKLSRKWTGRKGEEEILPFSQRLEMCHYTVCGGEGGRERRSSTARQRKKTTVTITPTNCVSPRSETYFLKKCLTIFRSGDHE